MSTPRKTMKDWLANEPIDTIPNPIIQNGIGSVIQVKSHVFMSECSIVNEMEPLQIEVQYDPWGDLIEISSLRKFFMQIDGQIQGTLEEMSLTLYNHLWKLVSPSYLVVRIRSVCNGPVETDMLCWNVEIKSAT